MAPQITTSPPFRDPVPVIVGSTVLTQVVFAAPPFLRFPPPLSIPAHRVPFVPHFPNFFYNTSKQYRCHNSVFHSFGNHVAFCSQHFLLLFRTRSIDDTIFFSLFIFNCATCQSPNHKPRKSCDQKYFFLCKVTWCPNVPSNFRHSSLFSSQFSYLPFCQFSAETSKCAAFANTVPQIFLFEEERAKHPSSLVLFLCLFCKEDK